MTYPDTSIAADQLLTKPHRQPAHKRGPAEGPVASNLLRQAVRRLELVSLSLIVAHLLLWIGVGELRGSLATEFRHITQWGPPTAVMVVSAVVYAIGKSGRFGPETMVRIGLVYEVAVSFGLACSVYLDEFVGISPEEFSRSLAKLNGDGSGLSWVALWMLFFTILVPARPREALVALLASACAVPITYASQVTVGLAPSLPAAVFFYIFVAPYLVTTLFAYVAARIVHHLGVEVRRAQELGSYRLERLLGRGGMGEVWRASHHMLARPAAVKLIRRDALGLNPESAALAAARFAREAQVIASLRSPHTVGLYDFGATDDGTLYYVMELLDGVDLEDLVRQHGPLPAERVVHILTQLCASLDEAHRCGLVHRDVKPANIYLCREAFTHDVVKLLDFGLVRQHAPDAEVEALLHTRGDTIAGTPAYMAPEMAMGGTDVDGRADLYSVGCVGFWLLTGQLVFKVDTPMAMIVAHVKESPLSPSARTELPVPEPLDQLILDCLAKDPAARPQTATEMRARLGALALARPWTPDHAARWWSTHQPQTLEVAR